MNYFQFRQALNLIERRAGSSQHDDGPLEAATATKVDASAECRHVPASVEARFLGDSLMPAEKGAGAALQAGDAAQGVELLSRAWRGMPEYLALLAKAASSAERLGFDPTLVAAKAWPTGTSRNTHGLRLGRSGASPEWLSLALSAIRGDWNDAIRIAEESVRLSPRSRRRVANLAYLHEQQGDSTHARAVLAENLLERGDPVAAAEAYLSLPPEDLRVRDVACMFNALRRSGRDAEVLDLARRYAAEHRLGTGAYCEWAECLADLGDLDAGRCVLEAGAHQLGNPGLALRARVLLTPVAATTAAWIGGHQSVDAALQDFGHTGLPDDPGALQRMEESLTPNFYMAYRDYPSRAQSMAYGAFVEQVVRSRYPELDAKRDHLPSEGHARIRIGYATSFARYGAVMRYLAGWLQHANRSAFEIHLFPLQGEHDWMTRYLAGFVDRLHEPATGVVAAAQQIREAELDVLVFPEIGMDELTMKLAAFRLAPVQCAAMGHPLSTGMQQVDYFLSSEAMEPADAAEHYSEALVTLPGLGLCVPRSPIPKPKRTRADFGLAEEDVVYLCTQSPFKLLPQYDDIQARIASAVPESKFLFIAGEYPVWKKVLLERLTRAFAARGLSADRHVVFIPEQPYEDYLTLNELSDVFLDPLAWSSGLTALDALSAALPMVVLPGQFMRGRQSFGMLKQLGIEETVARGIDEYVEIAVRLGKDVAWRSQVSTHIRQRWNLLFEDRQCVDALEAFFRWASGSDGATGDPGRFRVWSRPQGMAG